MEHSTRLWDAPDPTDALPTQEGLGSRPASPVQFRGMRRGIATALLAGGLLVVGGVAAVAAADPSASPTPNATTQPADPGSSAAPDAANPGHRGNCPDKDGSGSGTDGSGGSDSSPDASPDASNSDL